MIIQKISKSDFLNKFGGREIDVTSDGFFDESDLNEMKEMEEDKSITSKILLFFHYLPFSIQHPKFVIRFILPRMLAHVIPEKKSHKEPVRLTSLKNQYPFTNYNLLTSLMSGFNPNSVFEIGTYLGFGSACIKKAFPNSSVYTICPKDNEGANNHVVEDLIGHFFKKKNLEVNQIWGDSRKYDFEKLKPIDIIFIDGNHSYDFVYSDLSKASKIVSKAVILDDFIPESSGNPKAVYGPWNEDVVMAVTDFLKMNPDSFGYAYWIEESPYCILIKNSL